MSGLDQERARLLDRSRVLTPAEGRRHEPPEWDEQTDLSGIQGIVNGLALSGLVWVLLMFLVRHWAQ